MIVCSSTFNDCFLSRIDVSVPKPFRLPISNVKHLASHLILESAVSGGSPYKHTCWSDLHLCHRLHTDPLGTRKDIYKSKKRYSYCIIDIENMLRKLPEYASIRREIQESFGSCGPGVLVLCENQEESRVGNVQWLLWFLLTQLHK